MIHHGLFPGAAVSGRTVTAHLVAGVAEENFYRVQVVSAGDPLSIRQFASIFISPAGLTARQSNTLIQQFCFLVPDVDLISNHCVRLQGLFVGLATRTSLSLVEVENFLAAFEQAGQ